MQTIEQSREMAKLACEALADKKGEDIRVIDIAGISVLADYFIIANGTNESQMKPLLRKNPRLSLLKKRLKKKPKKQLKNRISMI